MDEQHEASAEQVTVHEKTVSPYIHPNDPEGGVNGAEPISKKLRERTMRQMQEILGREARYIAACEAAVRAYEAGKGKRP